MYIGITERGDAGIDLSWYQKIKDKTVDGAVLITKKMTREFIKKVIELHKSGYKIVVHHTITGWGASKIEPNVEQYEWELHMLKALIDLGFPKENCVLRIDPIFPTENGLKRVEKVIEYAYKLDCLPPRIRISILDEYKHVKERFKEAGFQPIYGEKEFQASDEQLMNVAKTLTKLSAKYKRTFECCAEDKLVTFSEKAKNDYPSFPKEDIEYVCTITGCISQKELDLMGLTEKVKGENNQKRSGCHCLSCKKELLTNKVQCPNKCIYCYWRTNN